MTHSLLGCERARSHILDINGLHLHLLEWGPPRQPAVCFLHGGAAHAHWFDAVAPALEDRFHVVALDQRGHGQSAWADPPAYATEDFAGDLVALLDRLGWEQVTLVGHSMGGHNAMAFAAWQPARVRSLVIVDARPAIPPERLYRMRDRGRRPPRRHPTLDLAARAFRLLPPETVADAALLDHVARASFRALGDGVGYRFDPACYRDRKPVDAWPLLERITVPTLIVRGELSPVLPREMAERMRRAIPSASLVEIPGAYHHLVLDRPTAFTTALTDFFRGVA